jgi:hypothetical protein
MQRLRGEMEDLKEWRWDAEKRIESLEGKATGEGFK